MSFLPGSLVCRLLSVAVFVVVVFPGASAGVEPVAVLRQLPDIAVRSLATSEDVRLVNALAGRPAILLLTDGGESAASPVGQAFVDIQRDYAPWFSWVAVLSGEFTVADLESVRNASPGRFERLYHDRAGALRASLRVSRLPALLLVDQDGAVHETWSTDGGAARLQEVAGRLRSIAAGSRRRHSAFDDFRLPQVGKEGIVSFLDVAGRESTMISFIHTGCRPCARQLEVLDFTRDRHAGRVSLVTVFLDDAADTRVRGFLGAAGVTPDFVLRDSKLLLAGRYGIDSVPALLIVDADGRIVLSRSGYREEAREELYQDIEHALAAGALTAAADGDPAVREARRIHSEACAYLREGKPEYSLLYLERVRELLPAYHSVDVRIAEAALAVGRRDLAIRSLSRYLAAEPLMYDSPQVRETISGLLAPPQP